MLTIIGTISDPIPLRLGAELNPTGGTWSFDGDSWAQASSGVLSSDRGAVEPISLNLGLETGANYLVVQRVEQDGDDGGEFAVGGGSLAAGTYAYLYTATSSSLTLDPSVGPTGDFRGEVYQPSVRKILT